MANKIQRLIYILSTVAPLCIVFSIVWYIQKGTFTVSIMCLSIGILCILLFIISFLYAKKNLSPILIRTSNISPNDNWVIAYIISYVLPFVNLIVNELNLYICGGIALLFILIVPFVNSAMPNPILFIAGYHFYQISTENGISGYILISKRKLRRKQDLKSINRIFEFLLLDNERK